MCGRVLYESSACITIMLSRIAQGLKASHVSSVPEAVSALDETLKRILDHAKTSGLVDHLCLCLANSGSSLISGSSSMLRAACEACRAIWLLIDALETLSIKESPLLFPLNALRSHSLVRLGTREHEGGSFVGADSAKVVDVVTRAFVTSKAIQVAIYYCLHQRFEAAMSAAIQVFCLSSLIFEFSSVHVIYPIKQPVIRPLIISKNQRQCLNIFVCIMFHNCRPI
jgi:fused-like protein